MKKLAILLALVIVLGAAVAIFTACQEKYDLVYANWNLGTEAAPTVEREMIKAFEKENGVKIKLLSFNTTGYDDGIIGSIARDEAPDVFMTSNIPFVLSNQYGKDISDMVANDPDWKNIPEILKNDVVFKGGTYLIPFQMHMLGLFVNVDLLQDEGIDLPKDDNYTYDWFKKAVTQITQHGDYVGLNTESAMFEWYPAAANKNLGYFTWDGEKYNLNTDEFKQGMAETKEFRVKNLTFGSMTDAMKAKFEGIGDVEAWNTGRIAFRWGYTYEVPDMVENSGFSDIRFIGIPSLSGENARTVNFPTLVPDYITIYKNTPNPELAYKFAKWMSFDPAGIAKRIELAKNGETANTLPMTSDLDIVEKFCDVYPIDGIETMYARLDSAVFEPTKTVPGYTDSRWLADTGITNVSVAGEMIPRAKMEDYLNACWNGDQNYTEHAADCDRIANQQMKDALDSYEKKY